MKFGVKILLKIKNKNNLKQHLTKFNNYCIIVLDVFGGVMNQEKFEILNQKGVTFYLPADVWEKLDSLWRQKKIKSKTEFLKKCIENSEEVLKVLEGK